MNKVISISLNGNAYQLEEAGYETLQRYLEQAERQLKGNPDKAEVIADLEQAIADKCASYLRPHKNVVSSNEIEQIIKEMGPVDAGNAENTTAETGQTSNESNASTADTPKRLYQIRDGAIISGLCKGIAVYFDIDVSIIRILFVFLAFVTGGIWALVYLIMMFLIPYANTTEDMAAARGAPFNAQEVIDQAKKHYSEFKDKKEWKRHWQQQRRAWHHQWHHNRHWWRCNMESSFSRTMNGNNYAVHIIVSMIMLALGAITTIMSIVWLFAVISLLTTGAIFGWPLPAGMPLWAGALLLLVFMGMSTAPFNAIRRATHHNINRSIHPWFSLSDVLIQLTIGTVIFWYAFTHFPQVEYFFTHFLEMIKAIWDSFNHTIHPSS